MARKTGHLITPKRAKNLVGVAKVVAPALIPVLAPVIARGAGMLSEQYDPVSERALGNHPQAYSHLGLIRAAISISAG